MSYYFGNQMRCASTIFLSIFEAVSKKDFSPNISRDQIIILINHSRGGPLKSINNTGIKLILSIVLLLFRISNIYQLTGKSCLYEFIIFGVRPDTEL